SLFSELRLERWEGMEDLLKVRIKSRPWYISGRLDQSSGGRDTDCAESDLLKSSGGHSENQNSCLPCLAKGARQGSGIRRFHQEFSQRRGQSWGGRACRRLLWRWR